MLLARHLESVGEPDAPPIEGLTVHREVDNLAVRFSAVLGGQIIGHVNVHDDLTRGGTLSCLKSWAQLHEHFVEPALRGRGVGTWLVRHAVSWLRPGGATRILASWAEELDAGSLAFLQQFGWREIGDDPSRVASCYERGQHPGADLALLEMPRVTVGHDQVTIWRLIGQR